MGETAGSERGHATSHRAEEKPETIGSMASSTRYSSYLDFLDDYGNTYQEPNRLAAFLRCAAGGDLASHVTIIDIMDGSLAVNGPFYDANLCFLHTLDSTKDDIQTRLIIMTCNIPNLGDYPCVKQSMLNQLGLRFDIAPDFFYQHFAAHIYAHFVQGTTCSYRCLPSEEKTQFHFDGPDDYDKMSAYVYQDPESEKKTILICITFRHVTWTPELNLQHRHISVRRSPEEAQAFQHEDLSDLYIDQLKIMTSEVISAGTKDVQVWFYPWIKHTLRVLKTRHLVVYNTEGHYKRYLGRSHHCASEFTTLANHFGFLGEFNVLCAMQPQIERFLHVAEEPATRSMLQDLKDDYATLRLQFEHSKAIYEESQVRALTAAQLREIKASARVAVSMKRLTKLAFVFIPSSFVTSFFGMNVSELGKDGTPRLWVVLVTAIMVFTFCLLPLLPSIILSILCSGTFLHAKLTLKILRRDARLAFWYVAMYLLFGPERASVLSGDRTQFIPNLHATVIDMKESTMPIDELDLPSAFSAFWSAKSMDFIRFRLNLAREGD